MSQFKGVWLTASGTENNWIAVSTLGGATTTVNTGVASSTVVFTLTTGTTKPAPS
jgi:hypothetical protein